MVRLAEEAGGARACRNENERYMMTGQTGSWLYMAPEVLRCEPYNEKVRKLLALCCKHRLTCLAFRSCTTGRASPHVCQQWDYVPRFHVLSCCVLDASSA